MHYLARDCLDCLGGHVFTWSHRVTLGAGHDKGYDQYQVECQNHLKRQKRNFTVALSDDDSDSNYNSSKDKHNRAFIIVHTENKSESSIENSTVDTQDNNLANNKLHQQ